MPIDFEDLRQSKKAIRRAAKAAGGIQTARYAVFRSPDHESDLRVDVFATYCDRRAAANATSGLRCDLKPLDGGLILSNTAERDCDCEIEIKLSGDGAKHFKVEGGALQIFHLRKCQKAQGDFAGFDPDTGDEPIRFRLKKNVNDPPPLGRVYRLTIRILGKAVAGDNSWSPVVIDTTVEALVRL